MGTLRCSSCGAPLPADSSSQIITCIYCGVSQQRVDVEKYYDQLRTDVYRWVQSMVPVGVQSAGQIDTVARAQIFENSIRHNVEAKQNSLNMQLLTACSNQLLVPPFLSAPSSFGVSSSIDPKVMLNESARLQGLAPFAQSDDQNSLLRNTTVSSETLGYVSNIMRMLTGSDPVSYSTIARNFHGASESLAKDPSRSSGAKRMEALATANEGVALLVQGNLLDAQKKFMDADSQLQDAQKSVMTQTSIISWYAGIKSEINLVESLKIAIDGAQAGIASGLSSMEAIKRLETYSQAFETSRKTIGPLLHSGDHIDPDTYRELCNNYTSINMARTGQRPVKILAGSGGTLWVASWVVDLNYSFATGALFMKKGMMVRDRLLLPAVFPLNPSRLSQAPEEAVTDVFSLKAPSSYWERMRGKEKSLTQDVGFASDSNLHDSSIPTGAMVIPPLSTKFEAERAVNMYLERVRQRLQDKLRMGIPTVSKLVYVCGTVQADGRFTSGSIPSTIQPTVGVPGQSMPFAI
jgi:hypothetical protein